MLCEAPLMYYKNKRSNAGPCIIEFSTWALLYDFVLKQLLLRLKMLNLYLNGGTYILYSFVQAWHGRLRQRATRAEKLRFQALKADDQEAYMKMVEESKNERLTMLLGKTNDLLVRLGAAVQRQKDAAYGGLEPPQESNADLPEVSPSGTNTPAQSNNEEDEEVDDGADDSTKPGDLLEGQRKYNSVVHSIQEKVFRPICIFICAIRVCSLINSSARVLEVFLFDSVDILSKC